MGSEYFASNSIDEYKGLKYEAGEMKNSELWKLAEEGRINQGDIFVDQERNELIFTGKSFQLHFTTKNERYEYVGMCVSDTWKYSHNDINELILKKNERR